MKNARTSLEKLGSDGEEKDIEAEGNLKKDIIDNISTAPNYKLLARALLAFGPQQNPITAQKELKNVMDNGLLTPQFKSLLLAEAIQNNQIDKVGLLLSNPLVKPSEKEDKNNEDDESSLEEKPFSNQEKFQLSSSIPLHEVTSASMMKKLIELNVATDEPLDDKGNTALHLLTNGDVAWVIIYIQWGDNKHFKENEAGDTPFHTCQNLVVYKALKSGGCMHLRNTENKHGETSVVTLLTRLNELIKVRDSLNTVEEWDDVNKRIQDLKTIVRDLFQLKDEKGTKVSSKNRHGMKALHLCSEMGDVSILKLVLASDRHYVRKSGPKYSELEIALFTRCFINGAYYTHCDLAIRRMQNIKERLRSEKNSEIQNNLQKEIQSLRKVIDFFREDNKNSKNNPLHLLVDMGELELLKDLIPFKDKEVLNKQNDQGETFFILALKKMHRLKKIEPQNAEEKELIDVEIINLKEFIEFVPKLNVFELQIGKEKKKIPKKIPLDLDVQDNEGNSALQLCVMLNDYDLVKEILSHPCFEKKSINSKNKERRTPLQSSLACIKSLNEKKEELEKIHPDSKMITKEVTVLLNTQTKITEILICTRC